MQVTSTCPKCMHSGKVREDYLGKKVTCPKCRCSFEVQGEIIAPPIAAVCADKADVDMSIWSWKPRWRTLPKPDSGSDPSPLLPMGIFLGFVACIGVVVIGVNCNQNNEYKRSEDIAHQSAEARQSIAGAAGNTYASYDYKPPKDPDRTSLYLLCFAVIGVMLAVIIVLLIRRGKVAATQRHGP